MSLTRSNQYKDFHTYEGVQHHYGFSDIENWFVKTAGTITGNPAAVAAANAQDIINQTVPTLTETQKQQVIESNNSVAQQVQGEAYTKAAGSIFSGLKWIIYAAVIVVIFVVLVEIKKAVS